MSSMHAYILKCVYVHAASISSQAQRSTPPKPAHTQPVSHTHTQALVDAPDRVRGVVNFKRLTLTDYKIDIPRLAPKKVLTAEYTKAGEWGGQNGGDTQLCVRGAARHSSSTAAFAAVCSILMLPWRSSRCHGGFGFPCTHTHTGGQPPAHPQQHTTKQP